MRKVILGVFLAAAVALAAVGCGKKDEQPSSSVQADSASSAAASSEAETPASSASETVYTSLADWYTGEGIDFSELNEELTGAVEGYTADVQVEGDILIFRYIRSTPIAEDNAEALAAEEEALEAYYAEGEANFKGYCEQIAEESGIDTLKAHIEVMNEDTTNAILWKELA